MRTANSQVQELFKDGEFENLLESARMNADVTAIEHKPLESEKQQAYGDGQLSAQEGKTLNDCPIMAGELCIEWVKGWKAWHEEHPADLDETAEA